MSVLTIQRLPTFSQSRHSLAGDLRSVCVVWLSNIKTSLSSSCSLSVAWCLSDDQDETSRGVFSTGGFAKIQKDGDDGNVISLQKMVENEGLCLAFCGLECTKMYPDYWVALSLIKPMSQITQHSSCHLLLPLIMSKFNQRDQQHCYMPPKEYTISQLKTKNFHCYRKCWVPEAQGSSVVALWDRTAIPSHGEQASARRSLTPKTGDKGCTASSGYLLSCPIASCKGWPASVWGWVCCLKESLGGPNEWVLLLLTRNERGMAERWLRELMGDKVKKSCRINLQESDKWAVSCHF